MSQPGASCSLSSGDFASRREVWEKLNARALRELRTRPDGMQLRYAPGAEAELRELALLEAECCSFADWVVRAEGDEVRLEVTAPPESVAAVHSLFAR